MCKASFTFSWTGLAALSSTLVASQSTWCWKESLREEEHLTTTFKQKGYPLPFIRAISPIQEPPKPLEESDEEPDDEGSQDERKLPLAVIPIRKGCE